VDRRISGFASIALVALLAGCGGGGGGAKPAPTPSPPPVDTTPTTFTFPDQSSATRSAAATSGAITITGINQSAAVSITGGEYSIDGAAFTSAAGIISNNQTIRVRVNTSGQFSTVVTATLTIGGVSATFSVTTADPDTTPDVYVFAAKGNVTRNTVVTSDTVTIAGIDSDTPVTITGGEYSINGGAFTSVAGSIASGQTLCVRLTSSAAFSTAQNAVLKVGGVSATFTVTTYDIDTTPDAFQFARQTDVARDTWVVSNGVTISGINTTTPISIANGEYAIGNGAFTSSAGTIEPGQALVVRVKSSATYSKSTSLHVTVGGVGGDFEAAAELPASAPDAVEYDGADTVYVLDGADRLVFRWSIDRARYLDPYVLDAATIAPDDMSYSPAYKRLYLSYSDASIRYIDVTAASPAVTAFTTMTGGIYSLGDAGNFLVTQADNPYSYGNGYVLDKNGATVASGGYYYGYSHETAWDPVTSRVYYFRDGISPNDLQYDVINQTTGAVTSQGETPYHGSYNILGPIRVSPDGAYVLLGSGDIYLGSDLTWARSIGSQVTDARWFADGSVVSLAANGTQATLRRLGANKLTTLEQLSYAGQPLRVVGTDQKMAVLVLDNGKPKFYTYVPSDDSDNDGVPNTQDAFPLDVAASVDTDGDGYPDSWNTGKSQADSTTGLSLDAFPQDAACWLTAHAAGDGTCDYGATIPNYTPDKVEQQGDTIYLLSLANRRVYRWSIASQRYLNPFVLGVNQGITPLSPTSMSLNATQSRLYIGYDNGQIRYIDVGGTSPSETAFANLASGVQSLSSAGNLLLAQGSNGYGNGFIINSSGVITGNGGYYYGYSRETAWDPGSNRVYYFRDGISPNDLHYDELNQATGQVASTGETPYHGDYNFGGVIRPTADGQSILVGTGDLYAKSGLTHSGTLGGSVNDARWFANGNLVALTSSNGQSQITRLSGTTFGTLEQKTYAGDALRLVGTDAAMVVITLSGGVVKFYNYVPNNDGDGDGVANTADAFPLDPAASVDSDHDGYPDAWNPNKSQADSTTGLTLDAFPQDAGCWLPAHGSGATCNPGTTVPNYIPDQVAHQGDVIFLLSSANKRVYRWSISGGKYLNPWIVGLSQGLSAAAPAKMAYSASHQRLYLGYGTGLIRYLDVTATNPVEATLVAMPGSVNGLASAGNYLEVQAGTYSYSNTSYVLDSGGATRATGLNFYYTSDTNWDPVTSRMYYVNASYSLYYEVIDQGTGTITSTGNTSYTGSPGIPPARASVDGQRILLGNGDVYAQNLTWASTLGAPLSDARWLANGSVVALTSANGQTQLTRLGSTYLPLEQKAYAGSPLRVLGSDALMVVLSIDNGTVRFTNYSPNDDSDGDGVTNTADAFPADAAASVDGDRDGYPDAWNAGKSQVDSTTGLTLDAFPLDAGCWLPAHASGGVCNPGATVPNYLPDQVAQQGNVVYLLSSANKRVYRWSISAGAYLNPWVVGSQLGLSTAAPTRMAYSAGHARLYLGYASGEIRYIDPAAVGSGELTLADMSGAINGLTSAGNFLVAQVGPSYYNNLFVLGSNGQTRAQGGNLSQPTDFTWDPVNSRLYYVSSGYALSYQGIDQTTGAFTTTGGSAYNGSYLSPPARVSVDGAYVLIGSGDFFAQQGLTSAGALGSAVTDARWFADGTLVTLTTGANQTTLRHLGSGKLPVYEQKTFTGQALRVVGSDTSMAVLVNNNGALQIYGYAPSSDSDGDGVANTVDAFPLDAAASVDTDGDGYPNSWNAGKSQADSTTGLVLDAFATESECWLASHGSGGVCNYAATLPNYIPDQIQQRGNVVYLLSSANRRVYRWSIATGAYLKPFVVGTNVGFGTLPPTTIAYSTGGQRLYVGYATGAIRYFEVTAGTPVETAFTTMSAGVSSLSDAGNYLLAQTTGGYGSGFILDSSGVVLGNGGYYYGYSRETAWDPVASRAYYFRDGLSPNDLHFDQINQATGAIVTTGETPYHGDYNFSGPIRVSGDGAQIVIGSGEIFARNGLTHTATLGKAIADAAWKDNLLVDVDTTDLVEIRDANTRAVLQSYQYLSTQPLRLVFGTTEAYLVHVINGTTAFTRLPFYDQDGDGIPRWWEQLYAGMSDGSAADATTDLDGDGLNNLAEYTNHSNPLLIDTDGDGLNDSAEINTWHTNPSLKDTDGDGLSDQAEVITYHSDPLDTDSDNDGYLDGDEVLYGGDPTDSSVLPQPLYNYTQTFESPANLTGWSAVPGQTGGPWVLDSTQAHLGSVSYRSGTTANSQISSVKFRNFLRPGTLTFWAKVDQGNCCNNVYVFIDGVQSQYLSSSSWTSYSMPITLGIHEIEWRFSTYSYGGQSTDSAWLDDVVFAGQ
jgi:hypothetical protein